MAKSKAELQSDYDHYADEMRKARDAEQLGDYFSAIKSAISAAEHADGMMRYENRFCDRRERHSIEAIDLILRYAPVTFEKHSLDRLDSLLRSQRRIEKETMADLASAVNDARSDMLEAHRLWNDLERQTESNEGRTFTCTNPSTEKYRQIAQKWEELRVIRRSHDSGSPRAVFVTDMSEQCRGKCPSCGAIHIASKLAFLDETECAECHATVLFVLLPTSGADTVVA